MLMIPTVFERFHLDFQRRDSVNARDEWRAYGKTKDGTAFMAFHPISQQAAVNELMRKFEAGESIYADNMRPRSAMLRAHAAPYRNEIDISELDL